MKKAFAGIDLGGTTIKVAIAESDGNILARQSISTNSYDGPDAVIGRMGALVQELCEAANVQVDAVGIGVPGLVDVASGVTKFLPNLPTQWRNVAVAEPLSQLLDCPVKLLNDVRTATLAELRFGHGREMPDATLAFFSLGTGVGGGVAIDGRLRLGPLGAAGELGHQTIIAGGPRCGCGNRGCLETLASGPAIAAEGIRLMRSGLAPALHRMVGGDSSRVTPREMAAAAKEDESIADAIETAAGYIGIAAANVVTILHPQLIVLGGGVAEIGERLTSVVESMVRKRVGMFPTDDVLVETSRLGESAGVMGAIALAAE